MTSIKDPLRLLQGLIRTKAGVKKIGTDGMRSRMSYLPVDLCITATFSYV